MDMDNETFFEKRFMAAVNSLHNFISTAMFLRVFVATKIIKRTPQNTGRTFLPSKQAHPNRNLCIIGKVWLLTVF